MAEQVIIIVLTALLLVVMGGTLLFFYFRSLRREIEADWQVVLDNLRLRLDKIPNLIETVRAFAPDEKKNLDNLAKLRGRTWPIESSGEERTKDETVVSSSLKDLFGLTKKYPDLLRDTNFLALRTEFKDVNADILKSVEYYNKRVARYNGIVRFILFLPFSLLFRFPKMKPLAFEA